MMAVYTSSIPLAPIPDNLTVPQFIFGCQHEFRPTRHPEIPWLIEDETGRKVGEHEVSCASDILRTTDDCGTSFVNAQKHSLRD